MWMRKKPKLNSLLLSKPKIYEQYALLPIKKTNKSEKDSNSNKKSNIRVKQHQKTRNNIHIKKSLTQPQEEQYYNHQDQEDCDKKLLFTINNINHFQKKSIHLIYNEPTRYVMEVMPSHPIKQKNQTQRIAKGLKTQYRGLLLYQQQQAKLREELNDNKLKSKRYLSINSCKMNHKKKKINSFEKGLNNVHENKVNKIMVNLEDNLIIDYIKLKRQQKFEKERQKNFKRFFNSNQRNIQEEEQEDIDISMKNYSFMKKNSEELKIQKKCFRNPSPWLTYN